MEIRPATTAPPRPKPDRYEIAIEFLASLRDLLAIETPMVANLARHAAFSCLLANLLVSPSAESKIALPVDEPLPLECSEASEAVERASTPLDTWLTPYDEVTHAFFDRYGASGGLSVGSWRVPTSLDWWSRDLTAGKRFRFADPGRFALLTRYTRRGRDRFRPAAPLWPAQFAPEQVSFIPQLSWRLGGEVSFGSNPVGQLTATAPFAGPAMKQQKCKPWARPVPIVVTSWGSDFDRLSLIDCDGNIDVDALDRISTLARIVGQKRPELPLPNDPNPPEDWPEEWVPGVRLIHPRLLWILQRIGEAFPKHTIHILSGYRRDARESSPHRMGRALDLSVHGIPKEQLFAFCMALADVGCGYYPYHPFVHVDVRPFGSRKTYWVDDSQPGERSNYVDSWPNVIESGALIGAESD
ncbi:MAG TPA: DUF882 domain-containing protein [Polyangiaceae bacterium]|nr:DUF882 domain-containing protein [Polyangiaceae bacterium]